MMGTQKKRGQDKVKDFIFSRQKKKNKEKKQSPEKPINWRLYRVRHLNDQEYKNQEKLAHKC